MQNQKSIKIDQKELNNASRCNNIYSCTSGKLEFCGSISESVNDIILHIEETHVEKKMYMCNYHLPFGGDHYCTCPARMYIYKKFGV